MFKSVSFWAFVALAAIVVLQLSPFPGVILMMFGAALLAGLLVHVFLATLAVEALIGRIPRILVAIPILAYGAYYGAYALEAQQIAAETTKLRSENDKVTLKFDPAVQALVVKDAWGFVADHKIPVAYQPSPQYTHSEYTSFRRLPGDQCKEASAVLANLPTILERADVGVNYHSLGHNPYDSTWQPAYGDVDMNLCMLRLPETPKHEIVSAVERDVAAPEIDVRKAATDWTGVKETALDFVSDGKTLATYYNASIRRLSPIPRLYIGCALDDAAPAWRCAAGFIRERETEIVVDPVGAVLGISKLSNEEAKTAPPAADFETVMDEIKSYRTSAK